MANKIKEDYLYLREKLPVEVWDKILENVTEVKDYHVISSASLQLRARIVFRAPQILFPEVLKVLVEHNSNNSYQDFEWLVTRRVCHAWKRGIDKILESKEYFLRKYKPEMSDWFGIKLNKKPNFAKSLNIVTPVYLAQLDEHFGPTHLASGANPFPRRKVKLLIVDEGEGPIDDFYAPTLFYPTEPVEHLYAAIFLFLKKYGHHIWYCFIDHVLDDPLLKNNFYNRKLPAILELMPNLRDLRIHKLGSLEMPDYLIPASFPTLHYLEYIYFTHLPLVIIQELLQKNPHVQCVDTMHSFVAIKAILNSLPNIRAVAFKLGEEQELQMAQLANLSRVERMWLDLTENRNAKEVFLALERHFSQNLVLLYLRLSRREYLQATSRLVLPYLKILHLEMHKPQRLNFLLPLKHTLEKLHVAFDTKPDILLEECRFGFQVYKFWKEPIKSKIWKVFPQLKILEIKVENTEVYCCTRKQWQRKHEWKQRWSRKTSVLLKYMHL